MSRVFCAFIQKLAQDLVSLSRCKDSSCNLTKPREKLVLISLLYILTWKRIQFELAKKALIA